MSIHNSRITIRIRLLGDKNAGKTSMAKQFLGDSAKQLALSDEHSGSVYECVSVIDGAPVTLEIMDSDNEQTAVTAWAHGVIVMFCVDNVASFTLAEEYIAKIKEVTVRNAVIVLVGNKADAKDRLVMKDDAESLAAKYRCDYVELSTLRDSDSAVTDIFTNMSQQILINQGLENKSLQRVMQKSIPRLFRRMIYKMTGRSPTLSSVKETIV